jgi:amidohydrolase
MRQRSKARNMLTNDPETRIREQAAALEPRLIELRRDIHSHPELAFEEVRTAGIVAAELTRMGISHRTGVGRTGVVGIIEGARPGPTLALRADMDALPIHEETGQPFASKLDGKMHACGHDIHTVTLLGAAEILNGLRENLAGRIVLLFQPAEEVLEGAPAMIADGAAEGLDMAIGFHNHPDKPVGTFGFVRGPSLAASDRFDIILRGKSGHAAHPYAAVDPIVGAAHLITQLQTVVAREQKPLHPCVVTVGMFQAGTTYNIIPERVHLKGTVRTLHAEARDVAENAIRRLVEHTAAAMRMEATITYRRMVASLVNDDRVLEPAIASVRAHFGEVVHEGTPSMGAEDFSAFAERVPAFHLGVGAGAPGRDDKLHNANYQPDERCIALGVQALSRIALDMLA